ncbi:DUF5683 domain-containing protein [Dokdonia sp. Hel_I_53]|uniref:DUF5683 domain-containing protein n=1 Tax=Dokdonia sp. Hel_I_53 TaxID=1566287 RepID=UPI00119BE276|nr:DUF5683 domain-containing protein [Dokdonia sp. Hel_I_53]TVZ53236.1 hypothetical protein OD90_2436 [Dokdonia sp. Hel_I_53]
MQNKRIIALVLFFFFYAFAKAQQEDPEDTIIEADSIETVVQKEAYDPLRPAKAAFYAAVLPGLGQVYNKDYWKLPLVYGALGSTIYGAVWNSEQSERFRDAYKLRLAGQVDEFSERDENGTITNIFSDDALLDAQKQLRRRRDLFILISAGVYVLQILEANVDAHLSQYDVDEDLTFSPDINLDNLSETVNYGVKLTYRF